MATTTHPTPPGYRSETAFQFDEDQADAIIRTTAYHRFDYETSAIWVEFRAHASIRHNIAKPFQRPANAAAMPGPLDRLPVELFHGILFRLDMHSLFKFRQVNLRSREMVDSLHEYQMVVKHGLNLYCALLRTKIGNEVTLGEFYTVLCTKACFLCGEFASFVHLLTWKKSCLKCLQEAPELQVVTARMAQRSVRITKAEIKLLRTLKTFPGQYTMEHRKFKIRHVVVSEHHAWLNSTVSILFGFRRPRRDKRFENTTLWRRVCFLITTDGPGRSSVEFRALGVSLRLRRESSVVIGARNGHMRLETNCMHGMGFWSISGGVNRLSFCGWRAMKVFTHQLICLRVLRGKGFMGRGNETERCERDPWRHLHTN